MGREARSPHAGLFHDRPGKGVLIHPSAPGAGLRLCPPLTMDKREFEVSVTVSELQRLQKAMKKAGLTFEEFMVQAVEEKLERMEKGEN